MRRQQVIDELRRCARRGANYLWFGARALHNLKPGIDPALVERAMAVTLPLSVAACRDLPDEYVPIAWRVLEGLRTPDATFLRAFEDGGDPGERLRRGIAWLHEVQRVDRTPKNRKRIAPLVRSAAGLAAARATVVAHGVARAHLLAILAHAGDAASVDALVDVIGHATTSADATLDVLETWFVPFVRGRAMTALAAELSKRTDERGSASALQALAGRFGARPRARFSLELGIDSRQIYAGLSRKAMAWIVLQTHALPGATAFVSKRGGNGRSTSWKDGTLAYDELGLGAPKHVDDLPRWLAAAAARLRVRWDPETLRVTSTLRGKARAAAVAWLVGA